MKDRIKYTIEILKQAEKTLLTIIQTHLKIASEDPLFEDLHDKILTAIAVLEKLLEKN